MGTTFFIASRYFLQNLRKLKFINLLTYISILGIGFVSMALIIVLSVFNGLEQFTRDMHDTYNPELKVVALKGKSFMLNEKLLASIKKIEGVEVVTEVIEDNVFVRYKDKEEVLTIKGVSDNYINQYNFEEKLVKGKSQLSYEDYPRAIVGIGVLERLGLNLNNQSSALKVYYPRRKGALGGGTMDLMKSFNNKNILVGGIFKFLDQFYDENIFFVSKKVAEELLDYEGRLTSLEIKTDGQLDISIVEDQVQKILGDTFEVKNSDEQQALMLRAVKVERFFAFGTCVLILAIASFNIFFSLAMLAIEKEKDMRILLSQGANRNHLRNIFLYLGAMMATVGTVIGLSLGGLFCYLQQKFDIISIGVETSIINAYPVKLHLMDFVLILIAVTGLTIIASFVPARNVSKLEINGKL